MAALCEDVNLSEKAFQALLLVDHVLDPHDLDGDLLLRLQVDGKLDLGISTLSDGFDNLILVI